MAEITQEQTQAIMDVIAEKCDELDLDAEQILDGIARSLIGAMAAFEVNDLKVNIDGFGQCVVTRDQDNA